MDRRVSAARLAALLGPATDRRRRPTCRLADGLRLLVADGRIPPGTRLPSERELTVALGVSRTTVTRAYAHLRDQGYLASRQGSGSVVAAAGGVAPRSDMLARPGPGRTGHDRPHLRRADAPRHGVAAAYEAALAELPRTPAGVRLLPVRAARRCARRSPRRYDERGLPTTPDQVLVTSGALSALAIASRAFVGAGDRVLMESPTYPNAIATLRGSGARVVGADIDQSGWDAAEPRRRRPAGPAAVGVPHARLPQPDRAADGRRGAGAARRRRCARARHARRSSTRRMAETGARRGGDAAAVRGARARTPSRSASASKAFWGGLRIGWVRAPQPRMAER